MRRAVATAVYFIVRAGVLAPMIDSMNVAWWVHRWSQINPDKPAVIFQGRTTTYAELHARAESAACWLQEMGIEKGDRVAVLLENCPEFLELYLACARLGAIFVPFNFRLAAPEIDYLITNCRPRLLVFSQGLAATVRPLDLAAYQPPLVAAVVGREPPPPGTLDYRGQVDGFAGRRPVLTASLAPADPNEPQVIMYTSGTTGQPKGAVLSYRKTFFNCLNANIFFKLRADDTMLVILPLFHSGGLFIQASPCLHQGGTIILHRRFKAERMFADIARHRVTKFLGVPTVYRRMLEAKQLGETDLSSLQVSAIGGEKVTIDLLRRCWAAGFPARQIMGQTETSILLWASEEDGIRKPGTVGRPVFYAEIRLLDQDGRPVPTGQVGEIVVRGPVLMKEYWRDPARTEAALRGGWLHTGDLARMDQDGYYYLVGRAKDMYISGGENVYPAEVEAVLRRHPAVRDAVVVGVADPKWGESGHAFIIRRDGQGVSAAELRQYCREHLAGYKVPSRVSFCQDFPRTPLDKVRKFLLVQQSG